MKNTILILTTLFCSIVLKAQNTTTLNIKNDDIKVSPSNIERILILSKTKDGSLTAFKESVNLVELNTGSDEINLKSLNLGMNISTEEGQFNLNFAINSGYRKIVNFKKSQNGFTLVTKQYRSVSETEDASVVLTQVVDYSEALQQIKACAQNYECQKASGSVKVQETWVLDKIN